MKKFLIRFGIAYVIITVCSLTNRYFGFFSEVLFTNIAAGVILSGLLIITILQNRSRLLGFVKDRRERRARHRAEAAAARSAPGRTWEPQANNRPRSHPNAALTGIFSFSLLLQMAAFFTMAAVIYTLDTDSTVLRNAISWTVFILPLTISLFTAVLTVRLYLRREGGCRYSDNDICLNALISCFIVTLIIWLGTVVPAAAADMEGWFVLSVFIFLPGVAALCGLAMGIMLVSTLLYMHKVK